MANDCSFLARTRLSVVNHHNQTHISKVPENDLPKPARHFTCEYDKCEESFESKSSLLVHYRFHHHQKNPYFCTWPNCSFGSFERTKMIKHVNQIHLEGLEDNESDRDPHSWIEQCGP